MHERRLLRAVLEDALEIYRHPASYRRRARRLLAQTERWIASDDRTSPFDFRNVCATLGIDADALRATLLQERMQHDPARVRRADTGLRLASSI